MGPTDTVCPLCKNDLKSGATVCASCGATWTHVRSAKFTGLAALSIFPAMLAVVVACQNGSMWPLAAALLGLAALLLRKARGGKATWVGRSHVMHDGVAWKQ